MIYLIFTKCFCILIIIIIIITNRIIIIIFVLINRTCETVFVLTNKYKWLPRNVSLNEYSVTIILSSGKNFFIFYHCGSEKNYQIYKFYIIQY